MREISLQMTDRKVSSLWWKELVRYFVNNGDELEIRCWKEETAEVKQAVLYGSLTEENYEVSVNGRVTEQFVSELLQENPQDKSIYNKMTKYFTINVKTNQRLFCSAHYGTEIYITGADDADFAFVREVMKGFTNEEFSIHTDI